MTNRVRCSPRVTENQNLVRCRPDAHEHALELRRLAHELPVLLVGAEAHHPLHAGPVVPGAVEHDDLARRPGRCGTYRWKYHWVRSRSRRLRQGHDRGAARVQVLGEPLDRAALARRVAALEDDHDPLPGVLHPVLQLDQLDLQQALGALVLGPRHPLGVRVVLPPGVDRRPVRQQQDRVVVLVVLDGQAGEEGKISGVFRTGGRQALSAH